MNYRFLRVLLSSAMFLLLASQVALADNVYATIRGVVTDQTGAVVQGAQITATNTGTGVSYTTKSQDVGTYEFLQLPTGTYTVSAAKQGFKGFKSTGITLTVNQVFNQPIGLQVGTASETVEVKAIAVQVETTDIQQKTVIGSNQIVDLPLIGRNFAQLEQLAPGVMAGSDRFGTGAGGTAFSINGSQSQQSSFLINGTDSNDIALNTAVVLPSPDAIQEFNLISSTINPEYGRNSGGIVNALIKSGTNQFHGTIFDFYRDTFLNTHNFFQTTAPVFHQNQFGGTVGGPVWKDKTFFFLSYQGLRARQPQAVGVNTVFSPAQRGGNFGADALTLANGVGSAIPGINSTPAVTPFPMVGDDGVLHPAGTNWVGVGNSGSIFNCGVATVITNPNGSHTVTNCSNPNLGNIGAAFFNSVSKNLMNTFVPLPNAANNQFIFNPNTTVKTDQGIARIDHNIGGSDQIWGSAIFQHSPTLNDLPFTGATLPGFGSQNTSDVKEFTVAYNHTFNTTTLNEVRLGYSRLNFDAVEPQKPALPSSFGFTGISPQNTVGAGMPVIAITGFFTLGFSDNGPQPRRDSNYQFTDNFSKVAGRHTTKFGFDSRRFQVDNPFYFLNDGHFAFGGNGGFSSGDPVADFLLGIPDGYTQNSGGVINARAYEHYLYGQDQWKARNNLTLTFGAGYQIDTPFNNTQFGGKAFNCFRPGQQSKLFPTAPVGLVFPGDAGCTSSGTTIKYGHIAPRLGFAYSPHWGGSFTRGQENKTSIRGSFGIYYNRYEEETALQNLGAPPFGINSNGVTDNNGSPAFATPFNDVSVAGQGKNIANKFPFTPPNPGNTTFDFGFFEPMSINTANPSLSTPYSMNYRFDIEREFPANTVLSVAYVGALGRNLYRSVEGNPITAAGEAACVAAQTCGGSALHRSFQHAFFPTHSIVDGSIFGSVATQQTDGSSNYHSLQVNVTKGMTHGLQLITSYTWSHSIDNGSGFENSSGAGSAARTTNVLIPGLDVGDSGFDARQRLVIGYVYMVPSLHKMVNWAPERVFGGWKLTGITTFQTGFPVDIGTSSFRSLECDGFSFFGGCPDNPNQLKPLQILNPRTSTFGGKKDYWFDPATFAQVPSCTYDPVTGVVQNANVCGQFGNVRRNSLHGPGINNFDFALLKDTKITERTSFQMGLEAYNLFNHTQFNNPNGNAASGNFGRITSAASGRLVQLRAKVTF